MDPDMALGGSMDPDFPMASGGSTGHSDQHVSPPAVWPSDIHMVSGGGPHHGHLLGL